MFSNRGNRRVLIVIAHPDDETIFMGGLIRRLVKLGFKLDVVCITGRFATPFLTITRRAEFQRACWRLKVRAKLLEFEDTCAPLPVAAIADKLRTISENRAYDCVFTHGVWGEYGHRHHRDVCLAVHRVFPHCVYCLSGPFEADLKIYNSQEEFELKRQLVNTVYYSQPGIASWCTELEQFAMMSPEIVETMVAVANGEHPVQSTHGAVTIKLARATRRSTIAFNNDCQAWPEVAYIPRPIWEPAYHQFAEFLAVFEASISDW